MVRQFLAISRCLRLVWRPTQLAPKANGKAPESTVPPQPAGKNQHKQEFGMVSHRKKVYISEFAGERATFFTCGCTFQASLWQLW